MLTAEARNRLAVVLVGARNPQNIGAAARAMQDFGFTNLRVVNAFEAPFDAAQLEAKSAVGAGEVMRAAQLFGDLPSAIADCTLVAGTTAIGQRELRQPVEILKTAAPMLCTALLSAASDVSSSSRVALLFGSEKTGLTNEQLSHCSVLLTIPLLAPETRHLSMNLGQAVAVCLYELTREGFEGARELPVVHTAQTTSADRERLSTLLSESMQQSGYARRFPANARTSVVRRLALHLASTPEEAATCMGFLKMMLRAITPAESSLEQHDAQNAEEPAP